MKTWPICTLPIKSRLQDSPRITRKWVRSRRFCLLFHQFNIDCAMHLSKRISSGALSRDRRRDWISECNHTDSHSRNWISSSTLSRCAAKQFNHFWPSSNSWISLHSWSDSCHLHLWNESFTWSWTVPWHLFPRHYVIHWYWICPLRCWIAKGPTDTKWQHWHGHPGSQGLQANNKWKLRALIWEGVWRDCAQSPLFQPLSNQIHFFFLQKSRDDVSPICHAFLKDFHYALDHSLSGMHVNVWQLLLVKYWKKWGEDTRILLMNF